MAEYTTNDEIRMKAGFEKAVNLEDKYVVAARREAQALINSALGARFTVPFSPVPEKIRVLTIKLAAYSLKWDAYQDVGSQKALEALRRQLDAIASGEVALVDDEGTDLNPTEGVTGYFGDVPRAFTVEQRF